MMNPPSPSPMSSDLYVVLVTHPNTDDARAMARRLVQSRSVACVNVIPTTYSVYLWESDDDAAEETLHDDAECLMILKTSAERLTSLIASIQLQHPYRVPEIIALPVEAASQAYLEWVLKQTRS
ncbi:MAG: divalent-cation tolerance protein CutA [Chlamydiia bacterium]